jgi:hypothetical protein
MSRFGNIRLLRRCVDPSLEMLFPFIGCLELSLTESRKQDRVGISMELLPFLEESSPQKLANAFTGDESWFHLENPENSMWLASGVLQANKSQKTYWRWESHKLGLIREARKL